VCVPVSFSERRRQINIISQPNPKSQLYPQLNEGGRDAFKLSIPTGATSISDILKELKIFAAGDVPVKLIEVGTQGEIGGQFNF